MNKEIHMAAECMLFEELSPDKFEAALMKFAELVRADERENGQKWFDAVTAQHKQEILAEREACAKVAFDAEHMGSVNLKLMKNRIGNAIRARSKQ